MSSVCQANRRKFADSWVKKGENRRKIPNVFKGLGAGAPARTRTVNQLIKSRNFIIQFSFTKSIQIFPGINFAQCLQGFGASFFFKPRGAKIWSIFYMISQKRFTGGKYVNLCQAKPIDGKLSESKHIQALPKETSENPNLNRLRP